MCFSSIASNRRVVLCNICGIICHVKCANVFHVRADSVWRCTTCQCQSLLWEELPFSNTNVWDVESTEKTGCDQHEARDNSVLAASLKRYSKNTTIAYLNIDSVAGFKFFELKSSIQECFFDIVVVGETKIDDSFPDSHFYIKGFRMFRKERNTTKNKLIDNRCSG